MVEKNFEMILSKGEKIIVQPTGGWCTEGGGVNFVKFLDAPNWTVEKKDEIEKIINGSIELGSSIGISGTPGFVIGEELIPGAVDKASLQEKIKAIREKK
jgi:hypothetical protein